MTDRHQGYVRVTAVPSARLTVTGGDIQLGSCKWENLLTGAGTIATVKSRWRLPEAGRAWVRTTVRDAETGEPLPCRDPLPLDSTASPYAPHGHHGHLNSDGNTWNLDIGGDVRLGAITYAYIDGTCEGWLPLGEVVVEIARGFEYRAATTTVQISPGRAGTEAELFLRFSDLTTAGWYSGDTHVHFVSTLGAQIEARGEDVQVINLLLQPVGAPVHQHRRVHRTASHFTGWRHLRATQARRTAPACSAISTCSACDARVMPWSTGGAEESELGGGLETTLSRWADECHAQGGTVVLAHFPVPNGEAAALLATGRLDAVEMIAYDPYNIGEYYRYLNAGYRITLVGGTDKMSSEVPIGLIRTYAQLPAGQDLDYWSWCDGVKRGTTFVTSGPLLRFTVNDQPAGAAVSARADTAVRVSANVQSIFDVDRLEIVANGKVVAEHRQEQPSRALELDLGLRIEEDSWIAARCYGPGADVARHHDVWARPIMAHTTPVYVTTGTTYSRYDADTLAHMLTLVDGSLAYIQERSRRHWPGKVSHRHGQGDHLDFLRAPFLEARDMLRRRLVQGG